ncbi:hypothetical protein [Pontibacter cellulosilyticus]|uniref:Lipoprotein n=1 Tax=Pontibacter cellulosilyticus TaxID=1720253 RepID=A0A923N5R2_9BACT|nr:hypothetical protein [Pontibacter cellulosilyticus]MBC5992659.1 hypothetical protein [Pontibacter cellulosilyticus]
MKTTFTKLTGLFAGLGLLLSSCASSYHSIRPERINYHAKVESNNVELQYKYDVLAEAGNKKYAKKEKKSLVQVVAVKYTNNTDRVIDLSQDVKLLSGANQFTPMTPELAHRQLKQGVPIYLLYLLLTPAKLITEEEYVNGRMVSQNSFPIGVVLGPGLTIFNIVRSASANKEMLEELQRYSIINRKVMPGETVYGLIPIANSGYNPITIKADDFSVSK